MKCYTRKVGGPDAAIALGTFDGVHLGHQTVLEVAQTIALCEGLTPCALSFLNHPLSVVGAGAPPLLTLPAEKALLAARCGLEALVLLPFTRELAALPAADFARLLARSYGARHIVVGENYTFGAGGAGDVALLSRLSGELGFALHVVPKVRVSGLDVSSTAIRGLLQQGDVRTAAALLGRAYSIGGPIVHGRRIGHRMGFPTVNIALPAGKLLPRFGVYFGYVHIDGQRHRAMFNLGVKPTVGSDRPTLEAYLLDFNGDLYGAAARVSFVARIRDERRFDSIEALSAQIARDVETARRF